MLSIQSSYDVSYVWMIKFVVVLIIPLLYYHCLYNFDTSAATPPSLKSILASIFVKLSPSPSSTGLTQPS